MQVGDRDYRIYMENMNDSTASNLLTVDILTSVISDTHQVHKMYQSCNACCTVSATLKIQH
jgi:hypothetical protein